MTTQDTNSTTDDAVRDAKRFWNRYDLPFDHGVAIKVRRSGLTRGSWGDGRARDTVQHLHVKEAFSEGRLSRSADSYLCDPGSHVTQQAEETPLDSDAGLLREVTCETCLKRMERWKLSLEERRENDRSDSEDPA